MKRILLASIILTLFSCSLLIFQISCRQEAVAQTTGSSNVIPFVSWTSGKGSLYTINVDGTNQRLLNIGMEATFVYGIVNNKIVYVGRLSGSSTGQLYTCNIDGSSPTLLSSGASGNISF